MKAGVSCVSLCMKVIGKKRSEDLQKLLRLQRAHKCPDQRSGAVADYFMTHKHEKEHLAAGDEPDLGRWSLLLDTGCCWGLAILIESCALRES